jgi:hypothetical protein
MTASGQTLFEKGDGSDSERLYTLYIDSKHADTMIDGGKIPTEATATIWITNVGLESNRAALSFDELREQLLGMGRLADRLLSTLGTGVAGAETHKNAG